MGRGLRLPPLMFTAAEALGLVMAVLEGHPKAADPADPVGGALAKIVRVLPERVAGLGTADQYRPSPELTTALIESSAAARRLRLAYRMGAANREMEVDPWAVVLRHSRWYLLCWSQTRQERRVLPRSLARLEPEGTGRGCARLQTIRTGTRVSSSGSRCRSPFWDRRSCSAPPRS
jgi:predicted DNA-binding transcriptional regulator YafY